MFLVFIACICFILNLFFFFKYFIEIDYKIVMYFRLHDIKCILIVVYHKTITDEYSFVGSKRKVHIFCK